MQVESPRPQVFLVDDEPRVCDSVRFLVESIGLTVNAFEDFRSFREGFSTEIPGCLILDLHLPDATGYEVLEWVRERRATIPIIVMTARPSVPKAVDAMKLGAVDFLEKPLDHSELLERVERAVAADVAGWSDRRRVEGIRQRLDRVTKRELEVLELVVVGRKTREIADDLEIADKTVERHRSSILKKMGVANVSELVNNYMMVKYSGNAIAQAG